MKDNICQLIIKNLVLILLVIAPIIVLFFGFFLFQLGLKSLDKKPTVHYDPDKPTEFFLIENQIRERTISEWYVIANAPLDMSEIIKLVKDYNRRTITVDMIRTNYILRDFYRETEYLTKNYQKGAPYTKPAPYIYYGDYPGQQINYHGRDFLITVTYYQTINSNSTYWSYYYNGLEERVKKRIDNIDEYFVGRDGNISGEISLTIEFD